MVCFVRGLLAGVAAALAAAPAFGFELIAGPAAPPGAVPEPAAPSLATPYAPTATQDYDRGGLFDEFRLGAAGAIDDEASGEERLFVNGTVLFDPLLLRFESAFATDLLSPRPHVGLALGVDGGASQLYAGFTWDVRITDFVFLEASLGGGVHDGQLDVDEHDAERALGCRFQFRQSAGLGVALGDNLRLVTSIDHNSDGGLCGESTGFTQAGAAIGYKF